MPRQADPHTVLDPASLAAELAAAPPSCGPVRLVAVDGHAGSGKTTFASVLAAELDGAPVLHLDDFATHRSFFGWTARLTGQVLTHLAEGRPAHYAPYDWAQADFPRAPDASASVPAAPVVLVEGVGAGRRALRPYLARLLWMDVAPAEAWSRGRRRDGTRLSAFWDAWTCAETTHFADDPSYPYANYVVHRGAQGYEVHRGLAGPG